MGINIAILIPIVAIMASAWVIVTALRLRGGSTAAADGQREAEENDRLVRENEELRQAVRRFEERIQVLERIATDPAERTAREIEKLR
jgi:cell division protein FtsB